MTSATDYDPIADRYAAGVDRRRFNALYERPATLALLPDVRGLTVLDAGCGPGWYAEWLAAHGATVIALDASARMAALTRERLGDRAGVHAADMAQLAGIVGDASLDLIVSSLALPTMLPISPRSSWNGRGCSRPVGWWSSRPITRSTIWSDCAAPPISPPRWWRRIGAGSAPLRFYQRPLSAVTEPLSAAGFVIERLVEPVPVPEFRNADAEDYAPLTRSPSFVLLRARRDRTPALGA
jgi:SAM-dependent methyltransferase